MNEYQIAKERLAQGELVALPTDTVYGIAALADDTLAVKKLFEIRKRPKSNPLTICLSNVDDLDFFLDQDHLIATTLAKKFWPGALTIVIRVNTEKVDPLIRAGSEYCGFRIPDSSPLRDLIKAVGPIVLPSANISGNPPLVTPDEIKKVFPELYVVEGECENSSIPSTVVKVDTGITVLREGSITKQMLDQTLNL
ncbi:MAG: Threonylcarbamoyl-AMP synthase [Chlamydiia bacterium]|nr:Threonylcarbamoyl-AMP synthase [Chlamydiia bacterium]